jgi:hypothetical protein
MYILVLDLTQGEEDVANKVRFWMDSLQARTSGAVVQVVLTKADMHGRERLKEAREGVLRCMQDSVIQWRQVAEHQQEQLHRRSERLPPLTPKALSLLRIVGCHPKGPTLPTNISEILLTALPTISNEPATSQESIQRSLKYAAEERWGSAAGLLYRPRGAKGPEAQAPGAEASGPSSGPPDSSRASDGLSELRKRLVKLVVKNQGLYVQTLPSSWVVLIDAVKQYQQEAASRSTACNVPWKTWKDYIRFVEGAGCDLKDDDLSTATHILHQFGILLYYDQEPELKDLVFLNPQGVVDVLQMVVEHSAKEVDFSEDVKDFHDGGRQDFISMRNALVRDGQLDHRFLPLFWQNLHADWETCHNFLRLLEMFDLAYPVEFCMAPGAEAVDRACKMDGTPAFNELWAGVHGVPARWSKCHLGSGLALLWPVSFEDIGPLREVVSGRRLYFPRLLPDGLFQQLLARCLGLSGVLRGDGMQKVWRSGAALHYEQSRVRVLVCMLREPLGEFAVYILGKL